MLAHDSIPQQSVPDAGVPAPDPAPETIVKAQKGPVSKNSCPLGITAESERLSCQWYAYCATGGQHICLYQGPRLTTVSS